MWVAFVRAAVYGLALTFLMWLVAKIVGPLVDVATQGPHSDAESVVRIGSYFNALTVENLTVLALVAVGIFLLGRAAVEGNLR